MSVTVYTDVNHQGKSAALDVGRHKLDPSMNDAISSVRVPAGWKATLYEHADFTGAQVVLTADTAKVAAVLHDKASSIVVEAPGEIYDLENGDDWFYFEDSQSS